MGIVAYTAIYGQYDPLRHHVDHPDVDAWLAFTDDPNLKCEGWETIVEPPKHPHPRMAAKWRKTHPPLTSGRSLWLDGSVDLYRPGLIDMVNVGLDVAHMTAFRHSDRTTIQEEASASLELAPMKYDTSVLDQVAQYEKRKQLAPGLWATTVLGRNHTPEVLQMSAAWYAHCDLLTYQDQVSLPYLLDEYDITVDPLPGGVITNPWFWWIGHSRDD